MGEIAVSRAVQVWGMGTRLPCLTWFVTAGVSSWPGLACDS
jgi:hypothetical protein